MRQVVLHFLVFFLAYVVLADEGGEVGKTLPCSVIINKKSLVGFVLRKSPLIGKFSEFI